MAIGDRVHELRIDRCFTMEELGAKVGVGKATIKKYESGVIKNIPSDKIEALADALETTPAYLMGWTDSPTEQYPAKKAEVYRPRTLEAQIVSFGMDCLPQEERKKILSILQTMYNNNPDLFGRNALNNDS